jgi:tetratricopeptide (TPR) repeat protein
MKRACSIPRAYGLQPFLILLAIAFALAGCAFTPLQEEAWIEIRTQNFQIVTTLPESEAVALAKDAEFFRSIVLEVLNTESGSTTLPTKVIIFENEGDFAHFRSDPLTIGWFTQTMRANYVAMARSRKLDFTGVWYHEYVHFLQFNQSGRVPPLWYREGLAEFLRTITVHEDLVIIGAVPRDRFHGRTGYWVPLRKLISLRDGSWAYGQIYMSSWALVHYLTLGREGSGSVAEQMNQYLRLLESGEADDDAFEAAFDLDIDAADRMIVRYLDKRQIRPVAVPLSQFGLKEVQTEVRTLSVVEVSNTLGELALVREDGRTASRYYRAALLSDSENARAHAGLGNAFVLKERWDDAEAQLQKALELDEASALNHLDYAQFCAVKASQEDFADQQGELLEEARRHFVLSWKLDDTIAETYAGYGATFLWKGQDSSRGLETLEHAHRLLPVNSDISHSLAQAYVHLDREDDARTLLARDLASSHKGDREEKLEEMLEEMRGDEEERASR